ncbi:MAG: molecular chaperone DnaK [Verrucomicrobia bacterium]|nr:MAG: molecular chaperone DnaK [Verrucomicrobiota bacterium]
MSHIVGIDLGTTNSLIGIMESGFPILVADENGERLTPSVVHFPEAGEPMIGRAALRARALAPSTTIYSIKRLMGTRRDEIKKLNVDYEIAAGKKGLARVRVRDREFSPEELSALILRKLKAQAERALGRAVDRAVITVPAYFNDTQRKATKRAGELAGFNVERIVNEPTAAALAYGLDRSKTKLRVGVYDLGGGTFDISILQLDHGLFEVLATNGNTQLGGDDIDNAIIEYVLARFGVPIGAGDVARLREVVIDAKHRLSVEENATIRLPFVGGRNLEIPLSRAELEKIAQPIIEKTRWHCARALADARLTAEELDEVILVGGATKMPLVRRFVREFFAREPNISQNPEEIVAVGATIQAGILAGALRDVVLLDVTPLSLGIETFGGLMNIIIPRNSTIPIKAGEMFTTAVNNQRAMSIKVLQGEREMAQDNWLLGQLAIEFEPAPKGVPRVGVQFEIDANGILHVLARDTKTGAERKLEMTSAIDVSEEAVERMLADSLEHAFDDMSERAWVEAKVKTDEMVAAIEAALPVAGNEISDEEHALIAQAVREVLEAASSQNLARLQRANSALDHATQNLADLVLRKAMMGKPEVQETDH